MDRIQVTVTYDPKTAEAAINANVNDLGLVLLALELGKQGVVRQGVAALRGAGLVVAAGPLPPAPGGVTH